MDPGPLQLLTNADSEIEEKVRLLLDANLRHCIRLNKLANLKMTVAKVAKETVNWQACLILAINEKRPAIVSYLVKELHVRLPFYHWNPETCDCSVCTNISADPRAHQVYVLDVYPCAVAPLYVFALDEDPVAYCLRMAARLVHVRLTLIRQNLLKAYKQSKRNISACLSLMLDQTACDREARQLLLDDVEEDLIDYTNRYSKHLGRTLMFAQFRLNKAVVHRATQTVVDAQFSAGSEFLGDMWSVIGFVKMLLICAFAYAVLTPISIIFPHPRLIRFLRSARILALMEVVSIATYLIAVFVGANASSASDVRSLMCFNSSDMYMQLQTFGLAFIIARIIDEAYNLSLMSGRQFYVSMFDYLLSLSLALHFSSLMFLIIWSETVKRYTAEVPSFQQSMCSGNRSEISICDMLNVMQPFELKTLQLLMEPVYYINSVTGFGNLFLYISLGNVFVWQKTMGVLALTVQSMMKDVLKFVSVLFIVFIAYTTAMTNSYRNFVCGKSGFGKTFSSVAIQFFWAMFGMTNSNDNELQDADVTWTQYFDPLMAVKFALLIGLILYASWMVLGFVVCVNLLIAMMSVTFQQIQEDKDNSWLYARTRRMLRFIMVHHHQLMPLPVPYNVASPMVFALHYLFDKVAKRCRRPESEELPYWQREQKPKRRSSATGQSERANMVAVMRDRVAADLRLEVLKARPADSSNDQVVDGAEEVVTVEEELQDDVFCT